ncbi:MAG: hypothetical protein OXQ27_11020 [Chloroflexota bacterium]|nr:hypothetical protein [Chloroflexota bacterium]
MRLFRQQAARQQAESALFPQSWLPHVLWMLLFLTGCAAADSPRALLDLQVNPAVLRADGTGSVTIQYHVAREAAVSLALQSTDGTRYVLRDRVPRGPGAYSFSFSGAVGGSVLPNGAYTVIATAEASGSGERTEQRHALTIANADTAPPVIAELHVAPAALSPNQDGVDDRLAISFTVSEPVAVDVHLLAGDETRWLVRESAAGPGTVRLSWPPALRHAPQLNQAVERLPAGPAAVEVAIWDRAGNRTAQRHAIDIGETGIPQVRVSDLAITPTTVQAGGILTVSARIANAGAVTLRAAPPGPATYAWGQDAPSLGYVADTGTVRWGVDFSLNRSEIGYPFRWSLGRDLAPGESILVTGEITISEDFPKEPVQLWLGVIHENNRILADKRGITRIHLVDAGG